jgi:peptidoglycan/LPS O-acetylase OafA/YrhL
MGEESKGRLANLDGLRGMAAIAVVLMHASSAFGLGWVPVHAYLAVDFFFLLSGYVIARAYDRRLQQGWAFGFMQRRLIRLYPFIVAGSLIGFLETLVDGVRVHTLGLSQAVLDVLSSLLVIPTPPLIAHGWRVFPADSPLWSLFFELAANVFYALAAPFLRQRQLWLLVGLSGFTLAAVTYFQNGDDFGLASFKLAAPRVLFSFLLGVALYRTLGPNPRRAALPRVPILLVLGVFACVLFAPTPVGWLYDILAVFAVFPLILVLALTANPGGRRWQAGCLTLGLLSYPVYAIHLPFLVLISQTIFYEAGPAGRALGLLLSLAALVPLSWLLVILYDRPVRRGLSAAILRPGDASGALENAVPPH